jgi:Periplasmic protease
MKNLLVVCFWLACTGFGLGQGLSPGWIGMPAEVEEFGGIGAVLDKDETTQAIVVAGVLPGLAADRAGLQQNDIIAEVDGSSVYGKDLRDVVDLIRGPVGSRVELTIVRDPAEPPIKLVIMREGVQAPR